MYEYVSILIKYSKILYLLLWIIKTKVHVLSKGIFHGKNQTFDDITKKLEKVLIGNDNYNQ